MRSVGLLVFLVLVAGCHHEQPDIVLPPDATIDASPPPNIVTIELFGETPTFLAYRDGDGPWQPVEQKSGVYQMHIHDKYELVGVCGDQTVGFDTAYEGSTFAETHGHTYVPCYSVSADGGTPVQVHGTMVQPGWVSIGYVDDKGTTSSWGFSLDVVPGMHDLIAIGNNRMTMRRDLQVAGAMTVPNVDVVGGGSAMPAVPYTVTGTQADETASSGFYLLTQNEFVTLPREMGAGMHVPPPSLTVPGDYEIATFDATTQTSFRSASTRYTGQPSLAFTLLPRLAGVQIGALDASWTTLPPGTTVELFMFGTTGAIHGTATPGWLGSATKLAFETDIPGFQASWVPSGSQGKQFDVTQLADGVRLTSGIEQDASVAKRVARLRRNIRLD